MVVIFEMSSENSYRDELSGRLSFYKHLKITGCPLTLWEYFQVLTNQIKVSHFVTSKSPMLRFFINDFLYYLTYSLQRLQNILFETSQNWVPNRFF